MSDGRNPLKNGVGIKLNDVDYSIDRVIGYGGSCLAYTAQSESGTAVIREFYTVELSDSITRDASNTHH